jgi:hypothetical protein
MEVTHLMPAGMVLIVALSGCAPERREAIWPEPRPLGREFTAYKPPAEPPRPSQVPPLEPTGVLSLEKEGR